MSRRARSAPLVGILGLGLALPAFAQEGADVGAPPARPEVEAETEAELRGEDEEAAQEPDAAAPARDEDLFEEEEQGPEIPTSQYLPVAEEAITEMRDALTRGLDLLRKAREAQDAVRLNCVNDKITAKKGILKISEDAYIALQEAVATRAMEKARYEFGKIRVSRQKMRMLLLEAQNCAGAEASYTGGTEVELDVDEAVAGANDYYGDPDFFAEPATGVTEGGDDLGGEDSVEARPPPSSPYQ